MRPSRSFDEILSEVADLPHWRVKIHPLSYVSGRLGPSTGLKGMMDAAKVSLRGWDFPYVPQHAEDERWKESCYWSKSDFQGHLEVHKLCASGLAVSSTICREQDASYQAKITSMSRFDESETPPLFLELSNQIWTITEFVEYAARLCRECNFQEGVSFSAEMLHCANFELGTSKSSRLLRRGKINRDDAIKLHFEFSFAELVSAPHLRATEVIMQWLAFFNATSIREDVVKDIQRELYELRIGTDRIDLQSMEWTSETAE